MLSLIHIFRVTLGECFGMHIGTNVQGKMVAALRRLGFDKVFDTDFGADLLESTLTGAGEIGSDEWKVPKITESVSMDNNVFPDKGHSTMPDYPAANGQTKP